MKTRVCALLFEAGKVLTLVYNYPNGRVWALPGGGVDEGESLETALMRELDEELGLKIEVGGLLYLGEVLPPLAKHHTIHIVFHARILSGTPKPDPQHTSCHDFQWLPVEKLLESNLYPDVRDALYKDLLSNRFEARYLGNCLKRSWL